MTRTFRVFCVSVVAGLLTAQDLRTLTADEAVEQAIAANLAIAVEERKLSILRREKDFSWNLFLPSVSGSATLGRLNEDQKITTVVPLPAPPFVTMQTVDLDEWVLGLNLSVQLPLNSAKFRSVTQTVIDYENGVLARETAIRKLERDVRKMFYQILAFQEAVRLTRLQVDNAYQRYLQAEANFRAGRTPELSMLRAQVSWENNKPALREQEQALQNLMMNFQFLLGLPFQTTLVLTGSVEPFEVNLPNLDSDLEALITGRLDLQSALGAVKSIENLLQIQQDALLPTLMLMFSMDPSLAEPFKSRSWDRNNWKQRGGMLGITLSVKADSFVPGSPAWVAIENLKDGLEQARLGVNQARRVAILEVTSLVRRLQNLQESLRALELNVRLAQRAAQLSEVSHRAGALTLLEVQEADLQLQTARLRLLNEKLAFNNAVLDLEYALNLSREAWK